MPRYRYEAHNDASDALRGIITAPSAAAATTQLETQGLRVQSVALDDRQLGEAEAPMAVAVDRLLAARDGLLEPLAPYAQEFATHGRRRELESIVKELREGNREAVLAGAGNDPPAWSALLAAAAENDGAQSLFARFLEREAPTRTMRRRRNIALAYPLFIAALCLAVVWALSLIVMPTFNAIFTDFGLQLPWLTNLVVAIGEFLSRGGAVLLLGLLGAVVVLWTCYPLLAPLSLRHNLKKRGLNGRVNRSLAKAKLSIHAANLVEARLPLWPALALADDAASACRGGYEMPSVSGAIEYAAVSNFDDTTRTRLLRALAKNYNEASAAAESWAVGMTGPLSIVTLGIIVGLTVIALFLPLVSLLEGLS